MPCKRPGRFDRVVFVLAARPAGAPARAASSASRPARRRASTCRGLAERTALFSGADQRALVERATDAAIDEALERGGDVPIAQPHLERALAELHPTTVDWLRTARNYVEFANQGGRYDDVLSFLDRREVRSAVKRR